MVQASLTRSRWLACLPVPVIVLLFLSGLALVTGSPGFRLEKTQQGLLISQVVEPLNPVRPGDVIVAVDGTPYHRLLAALFTGPRHLAPPATVTLLRDGERLHIPLAVRPVGLPAYLAIAWPHLLLVSVFLLLGVIALLRAPSGQPAHLFFVLLCGFATSIASTIASHFGLLQPVAVSASFFVIMVSNWIAFGAWAHFVCRFPVERDLLAGRPWPIPLFYLLPPLLAATVALDRAGLAPGFWGWMQRLRNAGAPLIIVGAFAKHLADYLRLPAGFARNQLKLSLAAYWLTFGPYLFLYLLPNLLADHPLIPFRWIILSALVLPAAYLVALLRHRLLGIDRMISRLLAHLILIIALTLVYSGFLVGLRHWLWGREIVAENLFLLFIIVVALLFNPLARMVQRFIERVIFRNRVDDSLLLARFSRRMASCLRMDDLVRILTLDLAADFNLSRAALLLLNDRDSRLYPEGSDPGGVSWPESRLVGRLADTGGYCFTLGTEDDPELDRELALIRAAGYPLVLSLQGSGRLLGLLLAGARRDGHLFGDQDIRTFSTLANQAAVALENARRYDSLVQSRKSMEKLFAKVVQSEKMAALGEMTAVLAHELKNPLGIIRSSAQYLAGGNRPVGVREEMLHYIMDEVDNLNRVISSLLGLARFRPPVLAPVDLGRELPALAGRWQRSGDHDPAVEIVVSVPEDLPVIHGDFKQLEQVMLNLVRNSEEAMAGGGRIEISARGQGQGVELSVRDTGPGIADEDLDNVFRKFFTTREKGLGLGLPICRQIVRAHNGEIRLANGRGGGTVATVLLPLHPLGVPDTGLAER